MTWTLLGAHAVAAAIAAAAARRLGPRALWVTALPAVATAAWAIWLLAGDRTHRTEFTWVDGLGLAFEFSVGPFAALLTLLIAGIGAGVFVYASGYFTAASRGLGRFAATLAAFAASMLGLVWASNIWTLFIFWELTSITSYVLIGHAVTSPAAVTAARRALFVTAIGGLALLAGFILLAQEAGSARLADLSAPGGVTGAVAALLVLGGAATKSAQIPFHVWLPGAMAAPTPVSAYLHSATMVKAGVVLVALLNSTLADVDVWRPAVIAVGLATMLWGAVGALRHVDAKLVLAWGTVSQLGLLVGLFGIGTAKATFAGVALLTAHAVFKAALFMVVGEVDVRTGTRRLDELGGLARRMPVAATVAVVSGLSMAGFGPLLGFAAKEAAVEAAIQLEGTELYLLGGLVIGGSTLTVAYTVRFLLGVFGPGPEIDVAPIRPAMMAPAALLSVVTVLGFVLIDTANAVIRPAAVRLDPKAEVYSLLQWPGFSSAAFQWSMAIVAVGTILGVALVRKVDAVPDPVGADTVDRLLDVVPRVARRVAGIVQHGSLPVYVITMAVAATAAAAAFVTAVDLDSVRAWDHPVQAVLGVLAVGAALAAAVVDHRLGAAVGLGVVGLAVVGLFVSHGAPDLAVTQLVVETVIVVVFVAGLGGLTTRFPRYGRTWRSTRIAAACFAGAAVTVGLLAAGSAPSGSPPLDELTRRSIDDGEGRNIVNVILTDVRALDTLGEIVVLAAVAIGVVALGSRGADSIVIDSPVAATAVRIVTPLAVVLAAYLFFAGHNQPGGGFAAGLTLGVVVALRTITRLERPLNASLLLGTGVIVASLTALAPLLFGNVLLDQATASFELPVLGAVKVGTALVFDLGVTLVVVGLFVSVFQGFVAREPPAGNLLSRIRRGVADRLSSRGAAT